jgi:hypothetical protein
MKKPSVTQVLKNLPTSYGTRMLITVFTRAHHWSLSWAKLIESILILSTYLHLGLPSGLFSSSFPTKVLYELLFSLMRATLPSYLILLDLITLIILNEKYMLWSGTLCSTLQPPVTSYLFDPNILLSTLFSNTLSLCSSLHVRDQVLHKYKTAGKIVVLYILILRF